MALSDRTDLRDRMSAFGSPAKEIGRAASVELVANDPKQSLPCANIRVAGDGVA
jgi:hypothetical protein